MQMPGFILHGWLCYYNDGEVVKKNIDLSPLKSINSCENVIRIAYGMKKESTQADPHGAFPVILSWQRWDSCARETPVVDRYEQPISEIRQRAK
jgi:hypothetical protein